MVTIDKLIVIFNELGLKVDTDKISNDATLDSIGIDSLDFFNILIELEKLTGVTVPDEDVDKLKSIDGIINYFS